MGNPFASRVKRTPSQPEVLSELDQFCGRLRLLGASDEEIETVRDTWDDLGDEWTEADRTSLTLLDDESLREELLATREEYQHDTTTETDQATTDATTHLARVRDEAAEIIAKPIPAVLEWVGADGIRAIAILELEHSQHGAGRKGIIEPLTELVAGDDPAGIPVTFVGENATNLDQISGEPGVDARGGADVDGSPDEAPPG